MTYTNGPTLKTERDIYKGDIINLCEILNNEYDGCCEFQPERISEGGILYNFKDGTTGYKSVRLYIKRWGRIKDDVMSTWFENTDMLLDANTEINIFLKSFDGAPNFTIDELQIWERCFNQIGLKRVGKFPSKRKLNTLD